MNLPRSLFHLSVKLHRSTSSLTLPSVEWILPMSVTSNLTAENCFSRLCDALKVLFTRAFEALNDFAWRVTQFDVPHDVSSFQDDSAPRIYGSAPINWDLKPILEWRRRHLLNYPIIWEAMSKTSRDHQRSGKVTSRSDASLLVTGDADVHMTGDDNASSAGPSIPQLSTAPTTSPSTEASITMTPSAGSTPNVDGEVDELDPQADINFVL
ncbi:hypothetical protein IW261DRAFT_1493846 [Armillaria novae-zelandiae]|uniref:Uncharacterized protein n=1 Tax=Armillaria novae-zelandiae TaxID=153914 RepID=A0AA39P166_9AGAR|nr:hypothetical protein IW261DRAFT_1493846 [Armillaria novae-zelandiae]